MKAKKVVKKTIEEEIQEALEIDREQTIVCVELYFVSNAQSLCEEESVYEARKTIEACYERFPDLKATRTNSYYFGKDTDSEGIRFQEGGSTLIETKSDRLRVKIADHLTYCNDSNCSTCKELEKAIVSKV